MMTIRLDVRYRTPNNANARRHWLAIMREKHRAQDAFRSSLRSIVSGSSTWTPSTQALRTCSIALSRLDLWMATKRARSISKSIRSGSEAEKKNARRYN